MKYVKRIRVDECDDEILTSMERNHLFGTDLSPSLKDLGFYEFSLQELNLPPADELLGKILEIQNEVGLRGWCSQGYESRTYQGFSLTYNPNFIDKEFSIYHQTWGSKLLPQNYGRANGTADFCSSKNSYYDSYAFRKKPPIVEQKIGSFLNRFSMPILRSRVAWHFAIGRRKEYIKAWHVDEIPCHILRINIPLQTSEEHVIDIVGNDEFGNNLNIVDKHLEIGKAYVWNTRIPHCVTLKSFCKNPDPRIHIVLGLCPWFDYNDEEDSFIQNSFYNYNIDHIVRNKLFIKS